MGAIHFNELRVTEDGKNLIIDTVIKSEAYYKNIYLDSIAIDDESTYSGNSVLGSTNSIYNQTLEGNKKRYRWVLTPKDLGLKDFNHLMFVYISIKGSLDTSSMELIPCGADEEVTMASVTNLYPFYQQAMQYIKTLGATCEYPKDFVDWLLKLKGLELAIKTGNYQVAIDLFNTGFKGQHFSSLNRGGCNCGT